MTTVARVHDRIVKPKKNEGNEGKKKERKKEKEEHGEMTVSKDAGAGSHA
jgi:hypothetical protein